MEGAEGLRRGRRLDPAGALERRGLALHPEYRNASVVHDVACVQRNKPWQDVHRMFYEACRDGGVGEQKAKLMYAAVYHFGPKWAPGGASMFFMRTMPVEKEFAQLKTFVETENPSLKQIEKFEPSR